MSHPVVERILSGDVPLAAKQAAARGALPIPREDLIELWVCLRNDPDPEVRTPCRESLAAIPEKEWTELLPWYHFRSEVLDFGMLVLGRNPKILEAALRNREVPDETVIKVSGQAQGGALDLILDNQTRLLRSPAIVVAMLGNPGVSISQVRRIYDIAEQFFRENAEVSALLEKRFGLKIGAAGGTMVPEPAPPPQAGVSPGLELEFEEGGEELEIAPEPLEEGEVIQEALMDAAVLDEQQTTTLFQQILHMNVPKKVDLAKRGNKEARGLLIRDSNKVVQLAVITSPKMTVEEAETFAKMRHLPDEVFRKIAMNRNFMKKYVVVKALAMNPKTPPGLAMRLVKSLIEQDIRTLLRDKGVSEVVRREAKKIIEAKSVRKS